MASRRTNGSPAPNCVVGTLVDLVPLGHGDSDLCRDLGLSVWMHRHNVDLSEATEVLMGMRAELLRMDEFSSLTQPTPLLGRSATLDVILLAHEVTRLLGQCSKATLCDVREIEQQLLERLERASYGQGTAAGQ